MPNAATFLASPVFLQVCPPLFEACVRLASRFRSLLPRRKNPTLVDSTLPFFCKQVFLMVLIITCECKATESGHSGMRGIARWETRNEGTHYIESRAASPIGLRASEEVVDTSGPPGEKMIWAPPSPPRLRRIQ